MKKLSIVLAAAFLFSLGASAQTERKSDDRMEARQGKGRGGKHGQMAKELNLSEDQKAKAKVIAKDFKAQHDALKSQESTLTVTQMKEKRKALMQNQQTQMRAILTAEQQAKFDEMKKKRMDGRGKRKMNRQV